MSTVSTTALSCPTFSPHAAATAVPLKSQCRSCHPAAQNPSVLPATHSINSAPLCEPLAIKSQAIFPISSPSSHPHSASALQLKRLAHWVVAVFFHLILFVSFTKKLFPWHPAPSSIFRPQLTEFMTPILVLSVEINCSFLHAPPGSTISPLLNMYHTPPCCWYML